MFAAYEGIPADQIAWADLDHFDDLTRDFPDMKPENIGLHSLLTDKSIHTIIDAHGLHMTGEDTNNKYLGFLSQDRMTTIYFDHNSFLELRKDCSVDIESFYGYRKWLETLKQGDDVKPTAK